ncbi:MAG: hypothetical protein GY679_04340 [Mycoplasma sp.]|nr:hypothetical protein [Mycoplasma sp.]
MSYLKENNGQNSSTRLMFIIGMSWAMITSTLFTYMFSWSATEFILVFTTISGTFIGLKLGQKGIENKKAK